MLTEGDRFLRLCGMPTWIYLTAITTFGNVDDGCYTKVHIRKLKVTQNKASHSLASQETKQVVITTIVSLKCFVGNKTYTSMIYPGSNVANMTCSGKDVINITNIEILQSTTRCSANECIISVDDRQNITGKCNGNTTCGISLDDMDQCISKFGYINLNYLCQRKSNLTY